MKKWYILIIVGAIIIVILLAILVLIPAPVQQPGEMQEAPTTTTMMITSSVFKDGEKIPALYTCDDTNVSPPLAIADVPEGSKSLVLIVDDPDAPRGTWTHWVMFNIDPETKTIEKDSLPSGVRLALNDFGTLTYGGPCPPSGVHRYFFKLFALNDLLHLEQGVSRTDVEKAMEGHVVGTAQLVGTYERQK